MDCKKVEDILSEYIENELSEDLQNGVSLHLETCAQCRLLKDKMEELVDFFPELEEDVPFFLKNRLYYIPESQEVDEYIDTKYSYLRWVAAVIGTFVLFLNLFYFTNLYPPANRILHSVVSKVKGYTVEAGEFFQEVADSKGMSLFNIFKKKTADPSKESDPDFETEKADEEEYIDVEKTINENAKGKGGKNGGTTNSQ